MVKFHVEINFSFIGQVLDFLENPSESIPKELTAHKAAQDVYAHALRFHNTDLDINDFWKNILHCESNKGNKHHNEIQDCIKYIKSKDSDFYEAFDEITEYLPRNLKLDCKLYLMVGYDIGIVSKGNAFLNVGHPFYHKNKRELLYLSMHELHHVGYAYYHPIYSLEEIKTTADLLRIIKHSTHLEGLAVYSPLKRRLREIGIVHEDYITIVTNHEEKSKRVTEFFQILKDLEHTPERVITKEDLKLLKRMSGGPRLWYITGAHMAQTIDEKLGRDTLIQTIINGADNFFEVYSHAR